MANTGNVTVSGNIAAGTGAVTLSAGGTDKLLDNNATISGNGAVLSADDMALGGGSINVGGGVATLNAATAAVAIDLGDTADDTAGTLELSDTELDTVTAATLRVGATDAGAIVVSEDISPANATNLSLLSDEGVAQQVGDVITVTGLRVDADTAVSLNEANDVGTVAIAVADASQAITFVAVDDVIVGTMDGTAGVTANGGAVSVSVSDGTLTINEDVAAGAASVTLAAGGTDKLFDNNAAVTGNAVTLTANSMDLVDGTVAGGSGRVIVQPQAGSRQIRLGSASEDLGFLVLSDSELDTLTTTSVLQIGSVTAGNVSVLGAITADGASYSAVSMISAGALVDATGGEQVDITATNLAIRAGGGIGDEATDSDLEISVTNLALANALAPVTAGSDIVVVNTGALIVPEAGVDGVFGVSNAAVGGLVSLT